MKKLTSPPSLTSLNKYVSAPALLNQVRRSFERIPDPRRYGQQFSLPDVLMSGLAIFGLKYPSLLKFDEQRNEERIRANLKSLYSLSNYNLYNAINSFLVWLSNKLRNSIASQLGWATGVSP